MTDRELMQQSFERMTGVADAWTNPALMQARNGFIQGWEAARLSAPEPPCKTGSQCIGGKCPQCVVSEPEPVAYMDSKGFLYNSTTHPENYTPLYKPKEDAK